MFLWTRNMQFWRPSWRLLCQNLKLFRPNSERNPFSSPKSPFFRTLRRWFWRYCGNFLTKSPKKVHNFWLFDFFKKTLKWKFSYGHRQICLSNTNFRVIFLWAKSGPPFTPKCLRFCWNSHPFHFRAFSYPLSMENIAELLRLMFLFAVAKLLAE